MGASVLMLLTGSVLAEIPRQWTIRTPTPITVELANEGTTPAKDPAWLPVRHESGARATFLYGDRLIVHAHTPMPPDTFTARIADDSCTIQRRIDDRTYVLETTTPRECLNLASRLANEAWINAAYPVRKAPLQRRGPYTPFPTDTYFSRQTYLENRDPDTGQSLGPDLNLRSAWPLAQGESVSIAIVDDGVDFDHPDLTAASFGQPHHNFTTSSTNGQPRVTFHGHGTAVAGLAAARLNNGIGIAGVAPQASLASWVIFDTDDSIVDSLALSDVFQFSNDTVPIQNHSWGNGLVELLGPTLIEQIALSNAYHHARGGKGIVMVRAGGNGRVADSLDPGERDANDDGYASDPGAIAVASVNALGQAATYSSRGACLLVAAPGGENANPLFTTDRPGVLGFNRFAPEPDLLDYGFDGSGFVGTSGSAPLVAGIAALMLSSNTELSVRDIQHILILASQPIDLTDPDLQTNQAGLRVSHNVGFGVPNAAHAVALAKAWSSRPTLTRITKVVDERKVIPDDGLHVAATGPNLPVSLSRILATPSQGLVPDAPTLPLPLMDLGLGQAPIENDLSEHGALIQRGSIDFIEKINNAAAAKASFAIIYNNVNGTERIRMLDTYDAQIPAVFIEQTAGEDLAARLSAGESVQAQLKLDAAEYVVAIDQPLICEHVGVRLQTNHIRRGDLRLTLTSPSGTSSTLQHVNADGSPGPGDWTYFSTHHFFESSLGNWTIAVSDMKAGDLGEVLSVELIILGVPIADIDADGLDDVWEHTHFGDLSSEPALDPDRDGLSNAVEQMLGQNPRIDERTLQLDISLWNTGIYRLSWSSRPGFTYGIHQFTSPTAPSVLLETIPGRTFETEWLRTIDAPGAAFYQVIENALPPTP